MMSRFFTFVFLFLGIACGAQHTLTVSDNSNFHPGTDGKVISVFTLDEQLSQTEQSNLNEWIGNNSSFFKITQDGLAITTEFPTNYNDRNVYLKMFYIIGVADLKVKVTNEMRTMMPEEFFQHFDL
jgi:hypothetical protein